MQLLLLCVLHHSVHSGLDAMIPSYLGVQSRLVLQALWLNLNSRRKAGDAYGEDLSSSLGPCLGLEEDKWVSNIIDDARL